MHHQWCVQLYANDYATKCPEGYGHVIICALCVNKALIGHDLSKLCLAALTNLSVSSIFEKIDCDKTVRDICREAKWEEELDSLEVKILEP